MSCCYFALLRGFPLFYPYEECSFVCVFGAWMHVDGIESRERFASNSNVEMYLCACIAMLHVARGAFRTTRRD